MQDSDSPDFHVVVMCSVLSMVGMQQCGDGAFGKSGH